MEFNDQDGDHLQFVIDRNGKLRQYVNGNLELKEITRLQYTAAECSFADDTGVFKLPSDDEQCERALGLRALASRAGVMWRGDEPAPATHVRLVDTDGDVLEFGLTESGKLHESTNGKVELEEVQSLKFDYDCGSVTDDTGVFKIPSSTCMQKVAALRSLAEQAGVAWSGDEPGKPITTNRTLDIENCAADWEYQCPKRWDELTMTQRSSERFCESCNDTVYFCTSEKQLQEHTSQRRCVAFDLRDRVSSTEDDNELAIRVLLLSGEELPTLFLSPTALVQRIKALLMNYSGIPEDEQRLYIAERELLDGQTLTEAQVTPQVTVHLVRVKRDLPINESPVKRAPPRRMMGKRRASGGPRFPVGGHPRGRRPGADEV